MKIKSSSLSKKKILVGITGGISAYKSIFLVRLLKECGAIVKVVLNNGTNIKGALNDGAIIKGALNNGE